MTMVDTLKALGQTLEEIIVLAKEVNWALNTSSAKKCFNKDQDKCKGPEADKVEHEVKASEI